MKQNVARIALGLAITLFFIGHAAEWYPTAEGKLDLLGRLDNIIYDMRLRMTMLRGVDERSAEHARNGVLAALEMQKQCGPLNQRLAARGWPALHIGVGVNSGTVRVGDMGSRIRRAYTAMGDSVKILVGEATRARVKDVVFREIDRVKVKGKEEAITIYEPLGLEAEGGELELWQAALHAYRARAWDEAEVKLLDLQRMDPQDELYRVYVARVNRKRRNPPPPDWDGVSVFDEK